MVRIIADDKIPFIKGLLEPFSEISFVPGNSITREMIREADALLIRTITRCDSALLEGTGVRFIGSATAGFDHIDTGYCEHKGIRWVHAPGCNARSVLQYVCSSLFSIAEKGKFTLHEKTLGIIGAGNIGKLVQHFGELVGMKVLVNDPPRARIEAPDKFVSLAEVLGRADILTFHVPLIRTGQDKTYHLLDDSAIRMIKNGSWLINTSRGEVIDIARLESALSSNKLSGVVLDVWENEPRVDSGILPLIHVATPHIAGYSLDGKANGTSMVIRELAEMFNFPLREYSREDIVGHEKRILTLDGLDKTTEEILREVVLSTYSIQSDDRRFRSDPLAFESLRGDYPERRDFTAYLIRMRNTNQDVQNILASLGFTVEKVE